MQVAYDVSDGLGEPVTEVLDFRVQDADDIEPVAPTANPDVIGREAGKPITISPLANDLPGSRPVHPRRGAGARRRGRPTCPAPR